MSDGCETLAVKNKTTLQETAQGAPNPWLYSSVLVVRNFYLLHLLAEFRLSFHFTEYNMKNFIAYFICVK